MIKKHMRAVTIKIKKIIFNKNIMNYWAFFSGNRVSEDRLIIAMII